MFIDFKAVKQLASLEQVATWLGLDIKMAARSARSMKEISGSWCSPTTRVFGIASAARKAATRSSSSPTSSRSRRSRAAQHIQTKFHGYTPVKKGLPEEGLDYLEAGHVEVQALGLSPETASELGIGYAPRGTMIKRVLFPLRDKGGKLLGYIGFNATMTPILKLPSNLCE